MSTAQSKILQILLTKCDRRRPKTLYHAPALDFGQSLLDFKFASHLWHVTTEIWVFLDDKILMVVRPDTMTDERRALFLACYVIACQWRPWLRWAFLYCNILCRVSLRPCKTFSKMCVIRLSPLTYLYEIRLVWSTSLQNEITLAEANCSCGDL